MQTRTFVVVPTLGSLLPGWILVLPKKHCFALSELSNSELSELNELSNTLVNLLSSHFDSRVVGWENGATSAGQAIGCGVDHAHLHLVPINVELRSGAENLLGRSLRWQHTKDITSLGTLRDGPSYLFVRETNGEYFTATDPNPPSQLLRKVVAQHIGHPELYDWHSYSGESHARSTVTRLLASSDLRASVIA